MPNALLVCQNNYQNARTARIVSANDAGECRGVQMCRPLLHVKTTAGGVQTGCQKSVQACMKQLVLPRTRLRGQRDLQSALHAVFGPDMLRRVHGSGTRVGEFEGGKRAFKFVVAVDNVPAPIRRFFCGSSLRITTKQTLDQSDPAKWVVTNRLKLHFVGAEFFKLRPTFWLEQDEDGGVSLGGTVRHDAVLPPPLNGIAEGFMMLNSQKELQHFALCLHEAGVLDAEALAQQQPPAKSD